MKKCQIKLFIYCYVSIFIWCYHFVQGCSMRTTKIPQTSELRRYGPEPPPKITAVNIRSDIRYRYSRTVVVSYIENPSNELSQEVTFSMILPDTAFISNFTMQKNGHNEIYVAKVQEKEKARNTYNQAVSEGTSAGLVKQDTRNANQITVRSNVEPGRGIEFTLTYEEFLKRHNAKYEHIIHINPGDIVPVYNVDIYIHESLPITDLRVPQLKVHPNEITSQLPMNVIASIEWNEDGDLNNVHIGFHPSEEDQIRMAELANDQRSAMSGQFIVQYDVNRKRQANEIQLLDGYFVHFFAPDYLEVLPKHVVFVLDKSSSMSGTKMKQTKDAMRTIFNDILEQDYFSLLTFSSEVHSWHPDQYYSWGRNRNSYEIAQNNAMAAFRTYKATNSMKMQALRYISELNSRGGTNINSALLTALRIVKNVHNTKAISLNVMPVIIFMTDGEATEGVTSNWEIKQNIEDSNSVPKVPIYGLAFGSGANFDFIKTISAESGAFARKIFEASDAPIQLVDFYSEISSPLLNNVTFQYVGKSFENKSTTGKLNAYFKGGEYVIAGMHKNSIGREVDELEIVVTGEGKLSEYKETIHRCYHEGNGDQLQAQYIPKHEESCIPLNVDSSSLQLTHQYDTKLNSENFIERLWAYLTIQNILDKIENEDGKPNYQLNANYNRIKALNLALKYNFVTKLTALVVVSPPLEEKNEKVLSHPTIVDITPIRLGSEISRGISRGNGLKHLRKSVIVRNKMNHLKRKILPGKTNLAGGNPEKQAKGENIVYSSNSMGGSPTSGSLNPSGSPNSEDGFYPNSGLSAMHDNGASLDSKWWGKDNYGPVSDTDSFQLDEEEGSWMSANHGVTLSLFSMLLCIPLFIFVI